MSSYAPIKLSNNPKKALAEIASYLRTVRIEPGRRVLEHQESVGYWQCTDWLDGLEQIASECERIAKKP